MKSVVAVLFFSLLASAAQAAPAALAEAQQNQVQKQERDQVQVQVQDQDQKQEAVVIPVRLLDRDGNYVQLLEPQSAGDTHFTFPNASARASDNDAFSSSSASSSYAMVCSRIPATHTQCVVRVWFDNHHSEEEGLVINDSDSTSLYPDPSEIVFAPAEEGEDEDDEPCVALGVDAGDGKGEQGLLVRKVDVHCP